MLRSGDLILRYGGDEFRQVPVRHPRRRQNCRPTTVPTHRCPPDRRIRRPNPHRRSGRTVPQATPSGPWSSALMPISTASVDNDHHSPVDFCLCRHQLNVTPRNIVSQLSMPARQSRSQERESAAEPTTRPSLSTRAAIAPTGCAALTGVHLGQPAFITALGPFAIFA
jgi:hypothetical protein